MSLSSAPDRGGRRARRRAFTLTELMIALSLSAIVFAAVLSSFLFMGRNLTRLVNFQEQEVDSRRAIRLFTGDISAASALTAATATALTVTKTTVGGDVTVSYAYDSGAGTVTRTESGIGQTLLTGVTAFDIVYYSEAGTELTLNLTAAKAVELDYTTTAGSSTSGTAAAYRTVSPRVVLRNKEALQ
jgi:prepilin-type N-terminal cleavage/methylation domain-containing protein